MVSFDPGRQHAALGARAPAPRLRRARPSGSFKDRASYLVAAFALKHGVKEVVLASTGNAASSMAALGAAAGLPVTVFLPAAAPIAKRIQVLQYGAELVSVDGTELVTGRFDPTTQRAVSQPTMGQLTLGHSA